MTATKFLGVQNDECLTWGDHVQYIHENFLNMLKYCILFINHSRYNHLNWCAMIETMIVSRSRTMHPYSPALTFGRTVLESDDLYIYWE